MAPTKLGVLAGGGPLPRRIVERCLATEREVFVIAFEGDTEPGTCEGVPHIWVRLGAVGQILRELKKAGCKEVVLAGPVRRPSFSKLNLDLRGMKLMGRIAKAAAKGDDALLSIVVEELEGEGFRVVGADSLLDDVVASVGVMGEHRPDADAEADIALGTRVARALGAHDVGQAVIVQHGVVLGVEAVEGTDALIARCRGVGRDGPGGVLVKLKKPGQERRADLPTIGVQTVERVVEAGLRGIAVEAGETIMLDRDAMIAAADRGGVFLVGLDSP